MTDRRDVERMIVAERGFQLRFLLLLSCIFAFGALLLFAIMFLFFSRPLQGDYSSVFFALRNLTVFSLPMVSFSALVYILLVCGAMAVLCIYTLHKVAGPLYRMSRTIESYIAGDFLRKVKFREGDQAALLATLFNTFIERLREDRGTCEGIVERAEREAGSDPAALKTAVEKAADEMETALSRYR